MPLIVNQASELIFQVIRIALRQAEEDRILHVDTTDFEMLQNLKRMGWLHLKGVWPQFDHLGRLIGPIWRLLSASLFPLISYCDFIKFSRAFGGSGDGSAAEGAWRARMSRSAADSLASSS